LFLQRVIITSAQLRQFMEAVFTFSRKQQHESAPIFLGIKKKIAVRSIKRAFKVEELYKLEVAKTFGSKNTSTI